MRANMQGFGLASWFSSLGVALLAIALSALSSPVWAQISWERSSAAVGKVYSGIGEWERRHPFDPAWDDITRKRYLLSTLQNALDLVEEHKNDIVPEEVERLTTMWGRERDETLRICNCTPLYPREKPPAPKLGPRSMKIFEGMNLDRDVAAENKANAIQILGRCEREIESSPLSDEFFVQQGYGLLLAAGDLWRARRGDFSGLKDKTQLWNGHAARASTNSAWDRSNVIGACFLNAVNDLYGSPQSGAPSPAAAPKTQSTPPAAQPQITDAQRNAALIRYNEETNSFIQRYPYKLSWDPNDFHRYTLFYVQNSMDRLERYKSFLRPELIENSKRQAAELRDEVLKKCPTCKAEYPKDLDIDVLKQVNEALQPDVPPAPKPPAEKPPEPKKRPPPKITMMAALGNGCVTALGRNFGQNEIDKSSYHIDLVLKNNCAKEQIVLVDVSGLGSLFWPALWSAGLWASTANADIPAGIPFKPLVSMSEGGNYRIPANGEDVASRRPIPEPTGSDNEMKVWVASCDAYSPTGMKQVIFRPATHFERDPRAFCGPSRIRN